MNNPLTEIREQLFTQDNEITSDPIFIVQKKIRIYGYDPSQVDCCTAWVDDEGIETDKYMDAYFESIYDDKGHTEIDDDGITYKRVHYIDRYEFVQPFFTRKAAESFINANAHNLTEPRIYVDSAYRNHEWQAIRKMLMEEVSV
jgi:hypothetical protein